MIKAVIIGLIAISGLFLTGPANAAGNCNPFYGGGENCLPGNELAVDKKVASPKTKNFVDNLSKSDPKYRAGDNISFQLTITNKGKNTLSRIDVTDKLPDYITYTSGPGKYDPKTRTITFNLTNLKANKTRKFMVVGNVDDILKATCLVNRVQAKSGKLVAEDNSKFCFEESVCQDESVKGTTKGGFPVMEAPREITETPATGPGLLPIVSLIPTGALGIYLRKRNLS